MSNGPEEAAPERRSRLRLPRVKALAREPGFPRAPDLGRRERALVYALRLGRRVLERMNRDRAPRQAASLSFQTLLSILPIGVVVFTLLRRFGSFSADTEVLAYLASIFLPESAREVVLRGQSLIHSADFTTLGVVGTVSLLPVMTALVRNLEGVYRDLFHAPPPASFARRLGVHVLLVTAVPAVLVLSLFYARRYLYVPTIDRFVGPFAFNVGALCLAIALLPGVRVRWRAAIAGAVTSGLLFEALKVLFGWWAGRLVERLDAVWGTVVFLPVFMIWVFLVWNIVLFGVVLAATIEELEHERTRPTILHARARKRPRWLRRLRRAIAGRAADRPA